MDDVAAVQDAEAENHCRGFLTNPATAPVSRHAKRNLTVDQEAESWCRRVLHDDDLPNEIRGVVLEGLVLVLEKHVLQGLDDRAEDAMKIHKELVMTFPDSSRFLRRA